MRRVFYGSLLVVALATVAACRRTPPEPEPLKKEPNANAATTTTTSQSADAAAATTAAAPRDAGPVAPPATHPVKVSPDDPIKGKWTLADATKSLPGKGALSATIKTSLGEVKCKLMDDRAPLTVANFIGLATGKRPWKDPSGAWVTKPAYDGTVFHRIIKGFMIQGGDSRGNGTGEPGYVIPDELWDGAKHDRAGLLCMANRGADTNGAQFFITDAAAPHLDAGYTIFGECAPVDVVHTIASTPVSGESPTTPVKITSVKIARDK